MKKEINQRTTEHKHTEAAFLTYNHKETALSQSQNTHFQHYHIYRHGPSKLEVISFPQFNEAFQVQNRMETLKRYKRPTNHWVETLVSYESGCTHLPYNSLRKEEFSINTKPHSTKSTTRNSFRNISWGDKTSRIHHKTNNPKNTENEKQTCVIANSYFFKFLHHKAKSNQGMPQKFCMGLLNSNKSSNYKCQSNFYINKKQTHTFRKLSNLPIIFLLLHWNNGTESQYSHYLIILVHPNNSICITVYCNLH